MRPAHDVPDQGAGVSWLLPTVVPHAPGKVRVVGEIDAAELRRLRVSRWARSARGRAWRSQYEQARRAERNVRTKRWRDSEKGKAWLAAVREQRNAYYRLRYEFDEKRRTYLREKQREYRAAKKAAA